jgi:hypothetical protein
MTSNVNRCTNCCNILSTEDLPRKCMVCGTDVCVKCSYFGLCEEHYYSMLKPDRRRLRELYMQTSRIRTFYSVFEIFCGGLVGILSINLILAIIRSTNVLFENLWIFSMGVILIFCGIISIRRSFYGTRHDVAVFLEQHFQIELNFYGFNPCLRSMEEYN